VRQFQVIAGTIPHQHIGAVGELLVQYQLLKIGIDSARMTTDLRLKSSA
jgi:hypothetical protein